MTVHADGFEWVPGNDAGPFVEGAPMRWVFHTTEGSSIDGAVAAYRQHNSWPHFTIDVIKRIAQQHVSLDLASRSLVNASGGVETNRQGAVQAELVGEAAKMQDMADADLAWLAELVGPVLTQLGISTAHPAFVGADQHPSGVHAAQRMTFAEWDHFNGLCGHQHVPENDHWDPGAFRIDQFVADLDPAPPHPKENDEMYDLVRCVPGREGEMPTPAMGGAWWFITATGRAWCPTQGDADQAHQRGQLRDGGCTVDKDGHVSPLPVSPTYILEKRPLAAIDDRLTGGEGTGPNAGHFPRWT